jgi:hypothetical protein
MVINTLPARMRCDANVLGKGDTPVSRLFHSQDWQ